MFVQHFLMVIREHDVHVYVIFHLESRSLGYFQVCIHGVIIIASIFLAIQTSMLSFQFLEFLFYQSFMFFLFILCVFFLLYQSLLFSFFSLLYGFLMLLLFFGFLFSNFFSGLTGTNDIILNVFSVRN